MIRRAPRSDRQTRDQFVENVFKAANLPLLRVLLKNSYSVVELSKQLQPYLKTVEAVQPEIQPTITESSARCPKCGCDMVLRTAKSGSNQGSQFWGCSRYPQCRGIVNLAEVSS